MKLIECPTVLLHPNAKPPEAKTAGAIGHDICCVGGVEGLQTPEVFSEEQLVAWYRMGLTGVKLLQSGEGFLFRTGFSQAIDPGYACLLWDRSSLGGKKMIHRYAGVIDPDYRGEWFVRLVNHSPHPHLINVGDAIVQGIYQERVKAVIPIVTSLEDTDRGAGGFGSTDNPIIPLPAESGSMSQEEAQPKEEDDMPISGNRTGHIVTYDGPFTVNAIKALEDRQPDTAVAWMARDKERFPNGVPDIVHGSFRVDDSKTSLTFEVLERTSDS